MRRFILIIFLLSSTSIFSQNIVTDTIFHKVERKETLFSISQKYKITINDLLSLNPELRDSRLRRRSTILVPVFKSPEDLNLKVVENELIETELTSLDSIYIQKKRKNDELNVSVLLPFRSSEVNFDSIQEVESLFEDRNLYTIALDFYSGILYAINDIRKMGVSTNRESSNSGNMYPSNSGLILVALGKIFVSLFSISTLSESAIMTIFSSLFKLVSK